MWDLTIHPPKGARRPRWHIDPGSGSDTICNSSDHPLARYCPLWHTRPHGFAFDDRDDSQSPHTHSSKRVMLGRGIHTLIRGCHKLRHLRLVKCYRISDKGLCEMAQKLPLLEELDITPCYSIALEAIGRGCPLLKSFKFNNGYVCDGNEEAFAIAQNMSNLRHLQLVGNPLDNSGLSVILDGCSHLESLDLRECYNVELEGILRIRCHEQLKDLRDPDAPLDF
ncbi:hypothetical protein Ahy_B09g099185 [Arachis hypogaea]|uniref:F-box/LRR-repeat protein n=1 Tax=Arachis hypogaea TaxID=3818 RepID=A0A444XT86_ARAHY|nr:hypothetical protein Ahy_B09g099185 [Arachis hypogaea]